MNRYEEHTLESESEQENDDVESDEEEKEDLDYLKFNSLEEPVSLPLLQINVPKYFQLRKKSEIPETTENVKKFIQEDIYGTCISTENGEVTSFDFYNNSISLFESNVAIHADTSQISRTNHNEKEWCTIPYPDYILVNEKDLKVSNLWTFLLQKCNNTHSSKNTTTPSFIKVLLLCKLPSTNQPLLWKLQLLQYLLQTLIPTELQYKYNVLIQNYKRQRQNKLTELYKIQQVFEERCEEVQHELIVLQDVRDDAVLEEMNLAYGTFATEEFMTQESEESESDEYSSRDLSSQYSENDESNSDQSSTNPHAQRRKQQKLLTQREKLVSKQKEEEMLLKFNALHESFTTLDEKKCNAMILSFQQQLQKINALIDSLVQEQLNESDEHDSDDSDEEEQQQETKKNQLTLLDQILAMILGSLPLPFSTEEKVLKEHYFNLHLLHQDIKFQWLDYFGRLPPLQSQVHQENEEVREIMEEKLVLEEENVPDDWEDHIDDQVQGDTREMKETKQTKNGFRPGGKIL